VSSIAVIGAGAWGTALAIQAARTGQPVSLWARDPARAREMQVTRSSPRLPGMLLPPSVSVVDAMPDADLLLLAVPLQTLRAVAASLPDAPALVACCKGIETGTLRLPLEILAAQRPNQRLAVLTGPNFAAEVAAGLPAASVVASDDAPLRAEILETLSGGTFRLYGNDDPVGAQLGGAAKNVIAIAAGAVIGAGLGENARAALVTRGLAEISRLVVALGGRAETASGLSGLGDLLLTCTGPSSRNFSLGVALGQGRTLADILASRTSVAEGVATSGALVARAAAAGVSLPVCEAVAAVVAGSMTVDEAMASLLARPLRHE
jgi:glycerol-3-phosphate dehydrogenase (NAD(P)+)